MYNEIMNKEKKTTKLKKKANGVEWVKVCSPVTGSYFLMRKASTPNKRSSRELFKNLDLK